MSLETWVMVLDWKFLDQFGVGPFLDRMAQASVTHLVFAGAPPIRPDPRCYGDSPVPGATPPAETLARQAAVRDLFREARRRGLGIYIYGTNPHMGGVPPTYARLSCKRVIDAQGAVRAVDSYWGACVNGPEFLPYHLGRIADTRQNFPEVEGFLNDGPEFGYEIAPGLMGANWDLFSCFGPCCEGRAAVLGYDFEALRGAAVHLARGLRTLDADLLRQAIAARPGPAGLLAAVARDPAVEAWLRFRRDAVTDYVRQLCEGVRRLDPALAVGVGSRLPAFAPLTGSDLGRLAAHADFLLPKIYLWMGGYDGLYGTTYRWLRTLRDWNPHVAEDLLLEFVCALFGFALPGVGGLADLSRHIDAAHLDATDAAEVSRVTRAGEPFPARFFETVVVAQVEAMIAQVGDPWRVRPWVATSHGGRALQPGELDQLLTAAQTAGLRTYLNFCPLADAEWAVAVRHGRPR